MREIISAGPKLYATHCFGIDYDWNCVSFPNSCVPKKCRPIRAPRNGRMDCAIRKKARERNAASDEEGSDGEMVVDIMCRWETLICFIAGYLSSLYRALGRTWILEAISFEQLIFISISFRNFRFLRTIGLFNPNKIISGKFKWGKRV